MAQDERIEGLLKHERTYLDLAAALTSNLTFVGDMVYVLLTRAMGLRLRSGVSWRVEREMRMGRMDRGG